MGSDENVSPLNFVLKEQKIYFKITHEHTNSMLARENHCTYFINADNTMRNLIWIFFFKVY